MTLYKMQEVKLNDNWQKHLHYCEEQKPSIESSSSDDDNAISSNGNDNDNPNTTKIETDTLIHDYTEPRTIHSLQDKVIEIAPTKENQPLGIFQDKYAEEMNFPTLFFGEPRDKEISKGFHTKKLPNGSYKIQIDLLHIIPLTCSSKLSKYLLAKSFLLYR